MLRTPFLVAALAACSLAGCGGDDEPARKASASTSDVARYCALGRELDVAGEEIFAPLGEDASPEEFQAAERRLIERFDTQLTELARTAPAQISSDVRTLLAAQRARAGMPAAGTVGEAAASAAEKRVLAFEKRRCDGRTAR